MAQEIELSGNWQYKIGSGDWKNVQLPADLSKVEPDYEGDAYFRLKKTIEVPLEVLDMKTVRLQIEGVTPFCAILINGEPLDTIKNFFSLFDKNIKESLLPGENEIVLEFIPASWVMEKVWKKRNTDLTEKMKKLSVEMEVRQPRYMFKEQTIGTFGKMRLIGVEHAQVKALNFKMLSDTEGRVKVLAKLRADVFESGQYKFESNYFNHEEKILTGRDRDIIWTFFIDDFKFWYPRGLGSPDFIKDKMKVSFMRLDGKEYQEEVELEYKIGFNKIELIQNPKEEDDFTFEMEGLELDLTTTVYRHRYFADPVAQGAYYTNFFKKLATTEVNMVHVDGGGGYPSNQFYDFCDSLGVIVWQDFAFAGLGYPADSMLFKSTRSEVDYQLRRITQFPSFLLFSGSHDLSPIFQSESAATDLGFSKKDWKLLDKGQSDLFGRIIPIQINRFNTRVYYKAYSPDFGVKNSSELKFGSYIVID